eukprot:4314027-Pleurochrysis_carterae.AAC.1
MDAAPSQSSTEWREVHSTSHAGESSKPQACAACPRASRARPARRCTRRRCTWDSFGGGAQRAPLLGRRVRDEEETGARCAACEARQDTELPDAGLGREAGQSRRRTKPGYFVRRARTVKAGDTDAVLSAICTCALKSMLRQIELPGRRSMAAARLPCLGQCRLPLFVRLG